MPRVNLDEEFFVDPRVDKLARLCKEIRPLTRGRLLAIYHHCYITRNPYKTDEEVNRFAEWDGDHSYADLMCRAGLAQPTESRGHYRISGVEKRITYLLGQSERGRRSAMARMMKTGSSQPIPKRWKKRAALPPPRHQIEYLSSANSIEQRFEEKVEIHRTMVRSSSNQSENSLCITPNLGSKTSNEGSKPIEHLLSSNINLKQIQKPRAKLTPEQIEEMKREAFRRNEQPRLITSPPIAPTPSPDGELGEGEVDERG